MALKRIAQKIGFDLPFYTRTGWQALRTPVPFGEMIPLYGDYADGFWERSLKETAGNYYKAFNFKAFRSSTAMDISRNLDKRPVARQMRKAILEYMNGNDFNPQLSIDNQLITNLFEKEAPKVDMFTKDSPDELKPKIK